jgi:hypothetical protein
MTNYDYLSRKLSALYAEQTKISRDFRDIVGAQEEILGLGNRPISRDAEREVQRALDIMSEQLLRITNMCKEA